MKQAKFDADTSALEERIAANKSTLYNLEEWILGRISLHPEMRILDLGCGTGKQMFYLQKQLSQSSEILGADISPEAVEYVNIKAKEQSFGNISAVQCALDDVVSKLQGSRFDLIMSTYAIYYSTDLPFLLSSLSSLMKPGAQLFVCGPGNGTNKELYSWVNEYAEKDLHKTTNDFISQEKIEEIANGYSSFEVTRLPNKVIFTSPEAVISWWTNHNSYVPQLHSQVSQALDDLFTKEKNFALSKNVLGVSFTL